MNFRPEIIRRVSPGIHVRRRAAAFIFLFLFVHGSHLTLHIASGQQKNISPRVASQEPPTPGPPGPNSEPPGPNPGLPRIDSRPPAPWVLIPLVPVLGIVWWLFDTESPVSQPVTVITSPAPPVNDIIPATVPCPTVSVSCPTDVDQGSSLTFHSSLSFSADVTYNWSVSAGTISSGQGSPSITVDTKNLGGQMVTATLELVGLDPTCSANASCSTGIRTPNFPASKFDVLGNISFNDEKARLDNYAIQLQNAPGAQGYIVVYGTCAYEAQARADRAKDYLSYSRGVDSGRLVTIDGGCRPTLTVELWVVPTGATPPAANKDNAPCPECKRLTPRRRERGSGVKRSGNLKRSGQRS